MNVSPASSATAQRPLPASANASERLRAGMDPEISAQIPDAFLSARIGNGTIASQVDRSVRVRFDGDGPRATATIVPETTAARQLMASPAGPAFERMIREVAKSGNPTGALEDSLHAITFAPDTDAVKGVAALQPILTSIRTGEPAIDFGSTPSQQRSAISAYVHKSVERSMPEAQFSAAWNQLGDVLVMPDVSRTLLASVGAYKPGRGDDLMATATIPSPLAKILPKSVIQRANTAVRGALARDAFVTIAHERQHSITEQDRPRESETTTVTEESTAQVLGQRLSGAIARATGSTVTDLAHNPGTLFDASKLGWKPWTRAALPAAAPKQLEDTGEQRYVDGPAAVRKLLKLAGTDLRTKAGLASTVDLLQGRDAAAAPRRLADAIIVHQGIAAEHREDIVGLVRASISKPDGFAALRARLKQLAGG